MRISTLIFILSFANLNAQKADKVYFGRDYNNSTIWSYAVTEIILSPDSILTRYDYPLPKNDWKNYKNYPFEKQIWRISKRGTYFILLDPESGEELGLKAFKIKDSKIVYYYKDPGGQISNQRIYLQKKKLGWQ